MNRIEMYSSSSQLRQGLHRVLAVSHALSNDAPNEGESLRWWEELLNAAEREPGRRHELGLEELAEVFGRPPVQEVVDACRAHVGLPPVDRDALASAFRFAIISGRAFADHGGRDVYGGSNKSVWDLVCADLGREVAKRHGPELGEGRVRASVPDDADLQLLRQLVAFDTSPEGSGHAACVAWLSSRLEGLGFEVRVERVGERPPLIVASREARGLAGHVVLYGHYDTTSFDDEPRWRTPPRELTTVDARLFGRGVADNKGPLAARLTALGALEDTPAMTWLIQGEEETGSIAAHERLPGVMAGLRAELWLDETGYHDHETGELRLLARTIGDDGVSDPPDPPLRELMGAMTALVSRWGAGARHERRGLNKSVVAGGCPFERNLPHGGRYIALGVNDSHARFHAPNESIPTWTWDLHRAELDVAFRWVDRVAREHR